MQVINVIYFICMKKKTEKDIHRLTGNDAGSEEKLG